MVHTSNCCRPVALSTSPWCAWCRARGRGTGEGGPAGQAVHRHHRRRSQRRRLPSSRPRRCRGPAVRAAVTAGAAARIAASRVPTSAAESRPAPAPRRGATAPRSSPRPGWSPGTPQHLGAAARAAMVSWTVDMPTRSAPSVRSMRHLRRRLVVRAAPPRTPSARVGSTACITFLQPRGRRRPGRRTARRPGESGPSG